MGPNVKTENSYDPVAAHIFGAVVLRSVTKEEEDKLPESIRWGNAAVATLDGICAPGPGDTGLVVVTFATEGKSVSHKCPGNTDVTLTASNIKDKDETACIT